MDQPKVRVLLIEDSQSDAALIQESLAQNSLSEFAFTHVETLQAALNLMSQAVFDVVLLDLSLPDCSGRETFLRAHAHAPSLPIVLMTSVDDEAVGLEAIRHGLQDYLIKGQSYGPQTARAIRYAIERKRSEEALKQAQAALELERANLEQKVGERTVELSSLNKELQAEIAQRKQAEQAHRMVRRRLSEAEESERARISRELHDRFGQDLTALKLGLQNLRRQSLHSPVASKEVTKLENLADSLMRDVHRLAWELRPSVLDDLGLHLALQRYADEWSQTSSVPVDLHSGGDFAANRLPHEFETTLYRITQEALTNVARHAQAKRVSILLERRPEYVSLIVEDDGRGFDSQGHADPNGTGKLGLLGMRERARLSGGTLTVESAPGGGTTVFARLPLNPRTGSMQDLQP
jgi:signal transduction histidine kinase